MQLKTTHWWKVPTDQKIEDLLSLDILQSAAQLLREGGLVAFPTETVYGLGADARKEEAIQAVFRAKGRPNDNPLIVHLGHVEQLPQIVPEVSTIAKRLIRHFWPGPLTLVMKHRGNLAKGVTAGLDTVAVRIPDHPIALALLRLADIPIAAPSANLSGRPSPTTADHVWNDLSGKIEILLDGGPTNVGIESTVVDVTGKTPIVLRPGGVTVEQLKKVVKKVTVDPALTHSKKKPRSPGMKYRHYAPRGELWLVHGDEKKMVRTIKQLAAQSLAQGKKVGILTTKEHAKQFQATLIQICGSKNKPEQVAHQLYHCLRRFDEEQIDVIYAESFPDNGLFQSVMNRLNKAANGRILKA